MDGRHRIVLVSLLLALAGRPGWALAPDTQPPAYGLRVLAPDALGAWAAQPPFLAAHLDLGNRLSRASIRWSQTDSLDWSALTDDDDVQTVVDQGLTVILTLRNVHPTLVNKTYDGEQTDGLPLDMDAYRTWVAGVAARFAALGVRLFQVGNEVYGGPNRFWAGTFGEYQQVLGAASAAIRGAVPDALVLPAGFATALYANYDPADPGASAGGAALAWYVANPDLWDLLDLHIYRNRAEVDDTAVWIRRLLDEAGLADKRLMTSECGGPDDLFPPPAYDTTHHAEEVVQRPAMALGGGFDHFITWHIKTPPGEHQRFINMSLVDDANNPKPAYNSFRVLQRYAGAARAVRRLPIGGDPHRTYLYRWDRPSSSVAVAWSWAGETISLPAPFQSQPLHDLFGAALGATSATLIAGESPVWIDHAPIAAVPVATTSLRLRDDATAGNPSRRRVSFASRTKGAAEGSRVVPPSPGSDGDPTAGGASGGGAILTVHNANGSGETVAVALPPEGWSAPRSGGYAFRGRRGEAVSAVRVNGDLLKVRGGGGQWAYTLDEPAQGRVAVRLRLGTGVQWCAEAPAKTSGSPPSTARHDTVGRFTAAPGAPMAFA